MVGKEVPGRVGKAVEVPIEFAILVGDDLAGAVLPGDSIYLFEVGIVALGQGFDQLANRLFAVVMDAEISLPIPDNVSRKDVGVHGSPDDLDVGQAGADAVRELRADGRGRGKHRHAHHVWLEGGRLFHHVFAGQLVGKHVDGAHETTVVFECSRDVGQSDAGHGLEEPGKSAKFLHVHRGIDEQNAHGLSGGLRQPGWAPARQS